MARFDRQVEMAKRLIKKNGQTVTWRQLNETIPDAGKPWKPESLPGTDYTPEIAFFTINKENRQFIHFITGTEAKIGDVYGLMGNVSFEPSLKDIVIRDGVTYQILNIDLLSPNGQKILYTVEFKK
ncbi:head closure [Klebsiella phage vB_KmiS-Kmi2C]|nr:head closure [Klebsiella phage vB_KmiS-Kmi2C]